MEKKYEDALERARMEYNADVTQGTKNVLETIFPELKESEDDGIRKEIISALKWANHKGVYDKHIAWLEKQGEQNPIMNVPTREVILSIWDLGNEWKEITNCCISTEHGTQLDYIQKHWHESEYYLREKQCEQKSADKVESKFKVDN